MTYVVKPANVVSRLNHAMTALSTRLEEIMAAKGWKHADLMRVSGQSSSVVSQWLGKGSKDIKSITKIDAIMGIARESGYSMLWIAEGRGPKFVSEQQLLASEPPAKPYNLEGLLDQLGILLASVPLDRRPAAAQALAGWAEHGGAQVWRDMFVAAMGSPGKLLRQA